MVVGEPQILGQVKEAYAAARAVGAVHSQLDRAIDPRLSPWPRRFVPKQRWALRRCRSRRWRSNWPKKIFGSLQGKRGLPGGRRQDERTGRPASAGPRCGTIYVANRTHERAQQLAQKFNGQAIRFEQLYETAIGRHRDHFDRRAAAIFRREHGERFLARRKNRPMFFIDIAVPRDVDAGLNKVDGIFVYDIDDLQQAVASHIATVEEKPAR